MTGHKVDLKFHKIGGNWYEVAVVVDGKTIASFNGSRAQAKKVADHFKTRYGAK